MGSPEGKNGRIHFGPFELDPDEQQLRKRGIVLKLQPQQFVVLLMLAQRAGEIVSRQEIQKRVWGDATFVDYDRGINLCISQIRAALGVQALEYAIPAEPKGGKVPEQLSLLNSFHRYKRGNAVKPARGPIKLWLTEER